MKFLYEYRTSDNVHHDGEICAASRDAAFAALRAKGIRPGRLVDAPGFFNKLFGRGKRWMAIGVLALLAGVLAVALVSRETTPAADFETSKVRRQIVGDSAIIEKGIATGWADVFEKEGDRFLASFAIPGVPAAIRATTEAKVREALNAAVEACPEDSIEVRQIKMLLEGVKQELRDFLAAGGSVRQFGRLLVMRQEEEISYYNRAKSEIDAAAKGGMPRERLIEEWERVNTRLRRMGVRLVSLPGKLEISH